ncbi:MAG: electron transporter RnfB [Erysipelotrichaceae bacterium]|nr:electron transporter RnfB [Erysipelotrichaceae bacterium]
MNAIIALAVIGGVLGCLLGIANRYLKVEVDERTEVVTNRLPGVNCGACGFPGCAGLADALVTGEVNSVSTCRVLNNTAKKEIVDYLQTTPGPDGSVRSDVTL